MTVDFTARAMMNPAGPDTILAPITTVSEDYTASFRQAGVRAKIRMAWELTDNHHMGLLVTTPVLRLGGKGTVFSNIEVSNLYLGGATINLLASSRQNRPAVRLEKPAEHCCPPPPPPVTLISIKEARYIS